MSKRVKRFWPGMKLTHRIRNIWRRITGRPPFVILVKFSIVHEMRFDVIDSSDQNSPRPFLKNVLERPR